MKNIRRSVVVVASLALVGGCSLGTESGDGGSDSETSSSTSSPTSTEETETESSAEETETSTPETETETESADSGGGDASGGASASVTSDPTDDASGSGERAPEAEQAVEDFAEAVADEDFEAVCDAFDPEVTEAIAQGGQDCATAMEESWDGMEDMPDDPELDVQGSELSEDGESATVTVKNQSGEEEEIPLEKIDGEWRISVGTT